MPSSPDWGAIVISIFKMSDWVKRGACSQASWSVLILKTHTTEGENEFLQERKNRLQILLRDPQNRVTFVTLFVFRKFVSF